MSSEYRVSPIDIQQKRFHVTFRGFDQTEVGMFLDLVRDEMETLAREAAELRDFKQSYDQRLKELMQREETVKNVMLMTQKLMEDQKENARRGAQVIIKDAEARALQMQNKAQDEKSKLLADIQELQRRKHHFLQDLKRVIEMHREMAAFEEAGSDDKKEPTPA